MRVAVTGGAGYIGSTLISSLVSQGHEVVSIDNLRLGDYRYLKEINGGKKLQLMVGDIRDEDALVEAFRGADAVAHLAALPGLLLCDEKPEEAISVNVYGTHRVLETARKMGVKRVVFCSSAATYGIPTIMPVKEDHKQRPLNLYGVTKLTNEKQLETFHDNYDMETVSLRFGNVYGVGLYTHWTTVIPKFVKMGLEGKSLTVYGDGRSSRDFVHVEDISQALTLGITVSGIGGEAFNVGSEPTTIGEIAHIVAYEVEAATSKKVEIVYLPPRPGETKEFIYDLTKIKSRIGFKPKWKISEGVKQIIRYKIKTG
jgi:nucleoside-diphosphate-sugar epimerase